MQTNQPGTRRGDRHIEHQRRRRHGRKAISQARPRRRKHFRRQPDALPQALIALRIGAARSDRAILCRHAVRQQRQRNRHLPRQKPVAYRASGFTHRRHLGKQPGNARRNQRVRQRGEVKPRCRLNQRAGRNQRHGCRCRWPGKAQRCTRRLRRQADNPHQLAQKIQHWRARKRHQILSGHLIDQPAHHGLTVGNQIN